jgi:hypothetical protein
MWHSAIWRLTRLQADPGLPDVLPAVPQLTARADPLYVTTVWLSSSVSMVALAGMLLVLLRPRPWARVALAGTTVTAAVLGTATLVWMLGHS